MDGEENEDEAEKIETFSFSWRKYFIFDILPGIKILHQLIITEMMNKYRWFFLIL